MLILDIQVLSPPLGFWAVGLLDDRIGWFVGDWEK
jgi:hypothetical protein